jgi:hydrogenase maturation protein HypF
MASAYLQAAGMDVDRQPAWLRHGPGAPDEGRWRLDSRLLASPTAAPPGTSAGRLFDAVASLLGIRHCSSSEAGAAMRLEAIASEADLASVKPYPIPMAGMPLRLDTPGLVRRLVEGRRAGWLVAELAAVFHESLAGAIVQACIYLRTDSGLGRIALSGGVFQNALLLSRVTHQLREGGFEVYANRQVPANDGGISLGQALVAAARTQRMRRA